MKKENVEKLIARAKKAEQEGFIGVDASKELLQDYDDEDEFTPEQLEIRKRLFSELIGRSKEPISARLSKGVFDLPPGEIARQAGGSRVGELRLPASLFMGYDVRDGDNIKVRLIDSDETIELTISGAEGPQFIDGKYVDVEQPTPKIIRLKKEE